MHPIITSAKNAKIRDLLSLEKSRVRKSAKLFVIEGIKEFSLALKTHYIFTHVYFCPTLIQEKELCGMGISENLLIPVSESVFEKIAYRKTTGGVVAIAQWKSTTWADLSLQKNPLLLVTQSIEKPGNLGALLRTASAARVDAVIICDPKTDLYNPNVVRSSVGCVFNTQVVSTTSAEAISWLKKNGITMYSSSLQGVTPYHQVNYNLPCAIVIGAESTGLDDHWKKEADRNIIIPMRGEIDSINASVTAGIIIFEALRQRGL